jgi:hypothetical protein
VVPPTGPGPLSRSDYPFSLGVSLSTSSLGRGMAWRNARCWCLSIESTPSHPQQPANIRRYARASRCSRSCYLNDASMLSHLAPGRIWNILQTASGHDALLPR